MSDISQDKAGQFTTRNGLVFDPDGVLLPIGNVVELLNATRSSETQVNGAVRGPGVTDKGSVQYGDAPDQSSSEARSATAHTDHPLRHFDRTCPACVAESSGRDTEAGPGVVEIEQMMTPPCGAQPDYPATASAARFSDFIRNASPEEKEKVYAEVMAKASEKQNAVSATALCHCGRFPDPHEKQRLCGIGFKCSLKECEEAFTRSATAPTWISVEDRLPPVDELVIAFSNPYGPLLADRTTRNPQDGWSCEGYVTHWMPLPVQPSDSREENHG